MTFRRVAPNSEFRVLRLLSEGGRWELGLSDYHHGVRLRMGRAGRPPQVMDFCLGRDPRIFPKALVAVLRRLESLIEDCDPDAVNAAFPWGKHRPDMSCHLAELLDGPAACG